MDVSIVIPVYNERHNVTKLYEAIEETMRNIRRTYEIIFVDDGSKDGTTQELRSICFSDRKVKCVMLRRNFGQTAALSAGIAKAAGEVVITMDADLQNDPKDIPKLLEKIREGYDVVSGWRKSRKDPLFGKKIPSLFSNWLARKLTGVKIHDFGCSLKAYRREAIKGVQLYGEMHRYIPALLYNKGFTVAEVEVNHRPRAHGKTKYGVSRLLKGLMDLMYIKFWSTYS
ncbi:MAG: glycosyltransferase family 2 protein, partial [Candidatus Altiarchaeota archaeon]|nr:glycosyltransferase family 2 protein [Candidatus Altiarchaeota archaeon]